MIKFQYVEVAKQDVINDIKRRIANNQTVQKHELFILREHVRKMNKPMLRGKNE